MDNRVAVGIIGVLLSALVLVGFMTYTAQAEITDLELSLQTQVNWWQIQYTNYTSTHRFTDTEYLQLQDTYQTYMAHHRYLNSEYEQLEQFFMNATDLTVHDYADRVTILEAQLARQEQLYRTPHIKVKLTLLNKRETWIDFTMVLVNQGYDLALNVSVQMRGPATEQVRWTRSINLSGLELVMIRESLPILPYDPIIVYVEYNGTRIFQYN